LSLYRVCCHENASIPRDILEKVIGNRRLKNITSIRVCCVCEERREGYGSNMCEKYRHGYCKECLTKYLYTFILVYRHIINDYFLKGKLKFVPEKKEENWNVKCPASGCESIITTEIVKKIAPEAYNLYRMRCIQVDCKNRGEYIHEDCGGYYCLASCDAY